MPSRPHTSRERFGEFLEKFRNGYYSRLPGERDDDEQRQQDPSAPPDTSQKARRRGYLRMYVQELWPHWKMVALLVVLALLVSLLELIQPLFLRYIIDDILLDEGSRTARLAALHRIALLYLFVVVLARLLGIWRSWSQRLLNVRVILTLRRALFERMLRLSLGKLSDMKTGGIIARLTDDINTTTGLLQMAVISPGVAMLRLLIAMVILFVINWKLAVTALAVIPPVMFISMIAIRRIRPVYRAIRKNVSRVDGRVGEAFQGIRAVRVFSGEHREEQEYTLGHHAITRMRMYASKREIILWSSWGFLMSLISVVIIWVGGYWYLFGEASIGDISAFQIYVFMLLNPVWQIVESLSELQRSMAAMERVFEILESPVDKPDRPHAVPAPPEVDEIRFDRVSFSYDGNKRVLHDFDLRVPGGSVVALVGRSGAGKTTVTDLLARFYDPVEGRITLNGIDLRDYRLDSYRDLLGVVQQEVFLFDGSVRENIAYADRQATLEQVMEASRRAHADEFIKELPEGYESIIGERGVKLSGGQRQRLSIARALLAQPKILILDEATSNLDTESEQLIQQSMTELLKDRTTFVIAHRLSTITHADLIVVMDEGRIVETGRHEELLARQGRYAKMVRRQINTVDLV
jgi:ATP-binding cassette subfamily B protein/subfamily B ATP-binding cassette protein MsbA